MTTTKPRTRELEWNQLVYAAIAFGIHPADGGKAEAYKLRERLLANKKVSNTGWGRWELKLPPKRTK